MMLTDVSDGESEEEEEDDDDGIGGGFLCGR